jgi:hypothetical protein
MAAEKLYRNFKPHRNAAKGILQHNTGGRPRILLKGLVLVPQRF